MPGAAFLRGERVSLRTPEPEDAEVVQRARNDPELREGLVVDWPEGRTSIEAFVAEANDGGDALHLLVCVESDRAGVDVVGAVELLDVDRDSADLVFWLLAEYRGRGYATESVSLVLDHAFDVLGLHHVVARPVEGNQPARSLLERLGFTHEGTYREHVFHDGAHRDLYHYGLLADEWRQQG